MKNVFKKNVLILFLIFVFSKKNPFLATWRLGGEIFLLSFFLLSPVLGQEIDFKTLSLIPLQEGGRVKPLDTFARESLRIITGHEKFEGRSSIDVLMDWLAHPDSWDAKEFILIENLDLKSLLSVPSDKKRIAPQFLLKNDGFIAYAKTSYAKQQKKIALNPMEKEALAVFGRLQRFEDIESGKELAIVPVPDEKTQKWVSLEELQTAYRTNRNAIPDPIRQVLISFAGVLKSYDARDAAHFSLESQNLSQILGQLGKDKVNPSLLSL